MIIEVKISSPEKWCPGAKHDLLNRPEMLSFVGKGIRIDTNSMRLNDTDGDGKSFREWKVIDEDLHILEELANVEFYDQINRICEHLIEIGD
jgi:hypothetical protein